MNDYLKSAYALNEAGEAFVTVTFVSSRGHAPQDDGAKAIITKLGLHSGTVGGGKVEAKAIAFAQKFFDQNTSSNKTELVTWNLQRDVGMTCGGEVTFFFELTASSPWKIVVFGAGHVAQALVRSLLTLDCQITCVDQRSEWIERLPKSPKLKIKVASNLPEFVPECTSDSFFVVMTQGHSTDIPVLKEIFRLHPNAPYIGCMGSDIKAKKMKNELKEFGVTDELIEKFRSPIGYAIGKNDPAEIAVSVTAQLLEMRDS